jgi:hypothetical protein
MKTIKRDRSDWVPRFSVGDRVLCHAQMMGNRQDYENSRNVWVPATVSKRWVTPPNDYETLHVYMCEVDAPVGVFSAWTPLYVKQDSEDMIMKHSPTFRFSDGDAVLFSTDKAVFDDSRAPKNQPWKEGRVVRVDVVGLNGPYAVYEVSFVGPRNRRTIYGITVDDDEHICRVDATPRERLMDAIDQRCSYAHIDYLVSTTELDVTTFQDLLITRAIQSCSYDAIWWLKDKTTTDLVRVVDTNGNGVLHQISMKPQAASFFERASELECEKENDQKLNLNPFTRREEGTLSDTEIIKAALGCMNL